LNNTLAISLFLLIGAVVC